MKAEDTVMTRQQINKIVMREQNKAYPAQIIAVAEAQAEISFKAGRESLLGEKVVAETLRRERKEGRMEVVEWIKSVNVEGTTISVLLNSEALKAKLKEWEKK